ncbi:MAG: hypothetical protein HZB29_04235 [Nitrospinae bacterium]|nr:hypothetical protein [Nitrospinota bacterium]
MHPIIITAAFMLALCASSAIAGQRSAGYINGNASGSRLISAGESVTLEADPSRLVKGDRLDIIVDGRNAGSRKAGILVVTSGPGEPAAGIVTSAGMEIGDGARVDFAFTTGAGNSPYLPFMRALAGEFINTPAGAPLRVAFLDVVNPHGARTQAGDAVFRMARAALCGRPQFDCMAQDKIAETIWRHGSATSRGLFATSMEDVAAALDVEVMVSGYLRNMDNKGELILAAINPANPGAPPLWMKLALNLDEAGGAEAFEKVTIPFRRAPMGHLKIRLGHAPTMDKLMAEYVEYADVSGWMRSASNVAPGGYYAVVGGRKRTMDAGGSLYDADVAAGSSSITIGFYPVGVSDGGKELRAAEVVEKTVQLHIAPGERVEMTVYGKVEGGTAVIAAGLD